MNDLMVVSPKKHEQFLVDVKGLYRRNFWQVSEKKKTHDKLFYVFALVPDPDESEEDNRFFILTESQVHEGIRHDDAHARAIRKRKGKSGSPAGRTGVLWKFAERHENAWHFLPK